MKKIRIMLDTSLEVNKVTNLILDLSDRGVSSYVETSEGNEVQILIVELVPGLSEQILVDLGRFIQQELS